ncbi:MAG: hypothetical protein EAY65_01395 [Alphaproteobacteria bacterium]|nr:MAG: hypothetical protein EAY65_01395 [Alphaproteobacteria bacterium]
MIPIFLIKWKVRIKRAVGAQRASLNARARASLEDALEAIAQETVETGKIFLRRVQCTLWCAPSHQREQFREYYRNMLLQVREDYGLEDGSYLSKAQQTQLESLRVYAREQQLDRSLNRAALRRIHGMLMRHPEMHQALHEIRGSLHGEPSHEQETAMIHKTPSQTVRREPSR